MRTRLKILTSLLLLLLLLGQCKETYVSPYKSPATGYLVVEGFIASGPTQFALSRVIGLRADSAIPAESGAQVQVEGNDNSLYPLTETSTGLYSADTLPLNPAAQYRLRIRTSGGAAYLSDFVPFRATPAIDSVNWVQGPGAGDVSIYINTHDPANATRYYQWEFDETWQYHSGPFSYYKYMPRSATNPRDTVVQRADTEYIYNCWSNSHSTPLLIGSTVKLGQDVVYRQQLQTIPYTSQKLDELYSILVRQYALTEAAYNYLSLMKANTESLGSIFDAQPSELKGNIHSLSNPAEPVVGFITAGTVRLQRIFINRAQLSSWGYDIRCEKANDTIPPELIDSAFRKADQTPIDIIYFMGHLLGWSGNLTKCVDCTIFGGSTKRPSWWPAN